MKAKIAGNFSTKCSHLAQAIQYLPEDFRCPTDALAIFVDKQLVVPSVARLVFLIDETLNKLPYFYCNCNFSIPASSW